MSIVGETNIFQNSGKYLQNIPIPWLMIEEFNKQMIKWVK